MDRLTAERAARTARHMAPEAARGDARAPLCGLLVGRGCPLRRRPGPETEGSLEVCGRRLRLRPRPLDGRLRLLRPLPGLLQGLARGLQRLLLTLPLLHEALLRRLRGRRRRLTLVLELLHLPLVHRIDVEHRHLLLRLQQAPRGVVGLLVGLLLLLPRGVVGLRRLALLGDHSLHGRLRRLVLPLRLRDLLVLRLGHRVGLSDGRLSLRALGLLLIDGLFDGLLAELLDELLPGCGGLRLGLGLHRDDGRLLRALHDLGGVNGRLLHHGRRLRLSLRLALGLDLAHPDDLRRHCCKHAPGRAARLGPEEASPCTWSTKNSMAKMA
mmetsp:Transcript_83631/g.234301  ORF Transcript_83631/g.234301 Transcript_83631/m.234301 type:complete len:326 (-) Transcript_83631:3-980(-)